MGAHEGDGGGFVRLTYTFEVVLIALDGVEKSKSARAPAMGSVEKKGVCFNDLYAPLDYALLLVAHPVYLTEALAPIPVDGQNMATR